ncbi:SDR family NAD(P)-dependent oxidoreductase [Dongia sedimenti]|uniref:Glucose 1-dehydrogenase n=1 Tax=Dongia sedimenti TaxID=3064282 RepID=A0ABU0YUP5_9PROT|nr:glucose 1-dehydrogenase [Rhodospirillaceae bacterium R-7]
MPAFSLANQIAIVTGASSGLGAHFARVLAEAGAKVALLARRKRLAEEIAAEIDAQGGHAIAFAADVTDRDSLHQALHDIEEQIGIPDILVNNAGAHAGDMALDLKPEDWDAVLETNLKGAWLLTQQLAQHWVEKQHPGVVINIASILGIGVSPGVMPYAVSKAGLIQMTKALALEWARYGIRVNALAPGYFPTDLNKDFFATPAGQAVVKRIPMRRLGALEDLDGPLLLLASPASAYMTGSVITVDGGHLVATL